MRMREEARVRHGGLPSDLGRAADRACRICCMRGQYVRSGNLLRTDTVSLAHHSHMRTQTAFMHSTSRSVPLWVALLCCFIRLVGTCATFGTIEITGRVEYRFFMKGHAIEAGTNRFRIVTDGFSARLGTVGHPALTGGKVAAYDHSSDGTNSVFVTTFVEPTGGRLASGLPIVTNTQTGSVAVESHNAFADVYSDPFPPVHTSLLGPVWLAYASGAFLKGGNTDQLPPFGFMGPGWPHIAGATLRSTWSITSGAFPLPKQLEQWSDAKVFDFLQGVHQAFGIEPLPESYRDGFACISYNVNMWTNIGICDLPLRWKLVRQTPRSAGDPTNNLTVQLAYDGFTESVQVNKGGTVERIAKLPEWTKVVDYRIVAGGGQPAIYTSERGAVLSIAEARSKFSHNSNATQSSIIRLIIVTILILPGVWFGLTRLRRLAGSKQPKA